MRIQEDAKWAKGSITETLTAARIVETASISTRQAERLLTSLKKKGFIVREGSDKSGVWVVKKLDNKVGVSTI